NPEDQDERQDRRARAQVEDVLGEGGENAALHPDHRPDQGVDEHEKRELGEVLADAQAKPRLGFARRGQAPVVFSSPRRLKRITRSISGGFAGTSARASTKASRDSDSIGFQRFSNAIVLDGLPLMPAPQTEPAKCAG